jgi:hypothetical protein
VAISCSHRRGSGPPGRPVRSPADALRALSLATDGGREEAVVLACLDHERRPLTMFIVEGAPAGGVLTALDVLLEADREQQSPLAAVILASSGHGCAGPPGPDDLAQWGQLERRCRDAGIELVDWFLLSDGAAWSVAEHAGWPPRW